MPAADCAIRCRVTRSTQASVGVDSRRSQPARRRYPQHRADSSTGRPLLALASACAVQLARDVRSAPTGPGEGVRDQAEGGPPMIFRSPFPDIAIPDLPLTQFVLRHAERLGGQAGAHRRATGRTLTYGATRRRRPSHRRRAGTPGLPQGRRLRHGLPEYPGVRACLLRRRRARRRHDDAQPALHRRGDGTQLVDAGARFVLTVPERIDVVREAIAGTRVEEVFVIGEAAGAIPFASLLADDGAFPPVDHRSGRGRRGPALFERHHRAAEGRDADAPEPGCRRPVVATVSAVAADEVEVTIFPCFHMAGVHTDGHRALRRGHPGDRAPLRPASPPAPPPGLPRDPCRSGAAGPLELSRHPAVDDYDLSQLREIGWGAAPLSEAVAQACRERLGCRVKQGYGLTEATPMHRVPSEGEDRPGSAGPVAPNTETKVVDVGDRRRARSRARRARSACAARR